jgi:hypothetical protein
MSQNFAFRVLRMDGFASSFGFASKVFLVYLALLEVYLAFCAGFDQFQVS